MSELSGINRSDESYNQLKLNNIDCGSYIILYNSNYSYKYAIDFLSSSENGVKLKLVFIAEV